MKIETLHIAKLEAQAGDTVVVKINQLLTQGNAEHARDYVARALPEGVKVLILDKDAEISVIEAKRPAAKRSR